VFACSFILGLFYFGHHHIHTVLRIKFSWFLVKNKNLAGFNGLKFAAYSTAFDFPIRRS